VLVEVFADLCSSVLYNLLQLNLYLCFQLLVSRMGLSMPGSGTYCTGLGEWIIKDISEE